MLNAIFLLSQDHEILIQKEFLPFKNDWSPNLFVALLRRNKDVATSALFKNVYYLHVWCDKIRFVAATEDSTASPLVICEYLEKIGDFLRTYIGALNVNVITSNIGLVIEILTETNDAGCPKMIEASKLKPLLCNAVTVPSPPVDLIDLLPGNLFGVIEKEKLEMPSDASKKPLYSLQDQTEKTEELYVDLIEKLTVIINADGSISLCNILGKLSVKSYLETDAVVSLNFPQSVSSISQVVFDPVVNLKENKLPRSLSTTLPPGNLEMMSYNVTGLGKDVSLPFTMYVNIIPTPADKMLVINLKIYCSLPIKHPAVNLEGIIPIPRHTLTVSGSSTLKNVTFQHDKHNSEYHFSSPLFPGSSHHSISTRIILSSWIPSISLELSNIILQFEVPMLCRSEMRITDLKVERLNMAATTKSIQKWVRYLTFSRAYEFRISDDWFQLE